MIATHRCNRKEPGNYEKTVIGHFTSNDKPWGLFLASITKHIDDHIDEEHGLPRSHTIILVIQRPPGSSVGADAGAGAVCKC